jgi:transposase
VSLALPPSAKIYLSLAPCDMRKGFDGLAAQVRNILQLDPFGGSVFLFRGKRGDRLKALVWDGSGLCLYAKRLERGKFVWPRVNEGCSLVRGAAGHADRRPELEAGDRPRRGGDANPRMSDNP